MKSSVVMPETVGPDVLTVVGRNDPASPPERDKVRHRQVLVVRSPTRPFAAVGGEYS